MGMLQNFAIVLPQEGGGGGGGAYIKESIAWA